MKADYRQKGDNLDYINPTSETITSGTVVIYGEICGIAVTKMEPGECGTIATKGVWLMSKDSTDISAGKKVYYDAENDVATATEKEAVIGIAIEDANADADTVCVRLNG